MIPYCHAEKLSMLSFSVTNLMEEALKSDIVGSGGMKTSLYSVRGSGFLFVLATVID